MSFQYQSLDRTTDSIRLLELQVENNSSHIQCTIKRFKLHSAPPYLAVSYVWGPAEPCKEISLNGMAFKIRQNLYHFLGRLQEHFKSSLTDKEANIHKSFPEYLRPTQVQNWSTQQQVEQRLLWIDAICVNQGDDEEKTHQVRQMAGVYKQAHCVLVWLGEEAGNSDVLMEFAENVQKEEEADRHLMDAYLFQDYSIKLIGAAAELCQREYWRRTWIIQEISLAGDHVVVHCGSRRAGLGNLQQTVRHCRKMTKNHEGANLTAQILSILRSCEDQIDGSMCLRANSRNNSPPTLQDLLEEHVDSVSSDARDKVYALLSLGRLSRWIWTTS